MKKIHVTKEMIDRIKGKPNKDRVQESARMLVSFSYVAGTKIDAIQVIKALEGC